MSREKKPFIDLQDERLTVSPSGIAGIVSGFVSRVRSGDLGFLPVVLGLIIISVIFQSLNPFFLSSANLSNLLMESTAVGILALGIVMVLLVGQIDLSIGSVSGLSAAIFAINFMDNSWPFLLAITVAILAGSLIGWVYGQIFNRIGVPSFVITLAGLLGILGLQLFVLGPKGTINLPFDSTLVWFGQLAFVPQPVAYGLVAILAAGQLTVGLRRSRSRRNAGLSAKSNLVLLVRVIVTAGALSAAIAYLYTARGVGWMFVFFVTLVLVANYALTRTSWGRSVFAVGGNREAARRAGINVNAVYTSTFVIASTLGAVGGLLAAGRLAASAQSSGGGDVNLNAIAAAVIGGTSLFGGRGSAFAALFGVIVIASISSGLTLMNLDSSIRYMVTGAVVLIAVGVDAIARRSRSSSGSG
jgi:simple sugar transport system permease protein/D-xylose transport system permease protein